MRLLLDTCVIIDWLTDTDPFDDHVWDILNDPGTKFYTTDLSNVYFIRLTMIDVV